jgi:NAD(P)H-flavin reductase
VFLCGPPAMVDAVRGNFTERALTPNAFFY